MRNLKVKKEHQPASFRDAIARMIADKITVLQCSIIKILQQWDRRYSVRQKKILLLVFCAAFGGYCGYLLINAMYGKANSAAISAGYIPPVAKPPPYRREKDSIQSIIK